MVDREKVIKGLECCFGAMTDILCLECPYFGECKQDLLGGSHHMGTDAVELLKEQDWHLITEDSDGFLHGLPGDDGQYLMTDGKDIWIDDYVDGVDDGIILDSGKDIREIVAWMHMPELPKLNRR